MNPIRSEGRTPPPSRSSRSPAPPPPSSPAVGSRASTRNCTTSIPAGSERASELTTTERHRHPHLHRRRAASRIEPDVTYGTREDGTRLDLDVCSPSSDPGRRARSASASSRSTAAAGRAATRRTTTGATSASGSPPRASWPSRSTTDWCRPRTFPAAIDDVATRRRMGARARRRLRHRPRPHRRLRRLGGRQPRRAARHAGRGHRSTPVRASPPSPS